MGTNNCPDRKSIAKAKGYGEEVWKWIRFNHALKVLRRAPWTSLKALNYTKQEFKLLSQEARIARRISQARKRISGIFP